MTLQITINQKEAEMLLKAIHELQHVVKEIELEEEGSSNFTPTDMVATNTAKIKIKSAMSKKRGEDLK